MKIKLSIILLFSVLTWAKSQTYIPLLDQRNEWQMISCYLDDCLKDTYYTDGDTIFNGQVHKILDGFHFISRTFLLRENIEEKKVYMTILQHGNNQEYLLYDFSMEVGDSIHMVNPMSPFLEDPGYYELISIDDIPDSNNQLKKQYRFLPSPSNTISQYKPVWIEGLGSLSLINGPSGTPDYDAAGKVVCFYKNMELFYFDNEKLETCQSILQNQESQNISTNLKYVQLSANQGMLINSQGLEDFHVYNLSGQEMKAKFYDVDTNRTKIDFYGLSNGVYFIQYREKGEIKTISIVKK